VLCGKRTRTFPRKKVVRYVLGPKENVIERREGEKTLVNYPVELTSLSTKISFSNNFSSNFNFKVKVVVT
jgi:hypothetical protein